MTETNHHPDFGTGEKTFEIYLVGLIACIFLTLLPFGAVIYPVLSPATTVGLVVTSAIAQFLVQLVCFLRLNYHSEQARLNVDSFGFFLFIVFVIILGSLWIMSNLNYFMSH